MQRREMLLTTGASALGLLNFPFGFSSAADSPKRRVLMFTKSAGFQHSVVTRKNDELAHAEKILTELGAKNGFDVTATKDGRIFDSDLGSYDAFFFYTTGDLTSATPTDKSPPMSADGKKRLLDAVREGKGFVGSHCASDTFHSKGQSNERQNPPDEYIAMLGGEFIVHGRQRKSLQHVASPKFPGAHAAGEGFELHEEWYALKNFADDLHVILVQETKGMEDEPCYNRPPYPATWARKHGKGRVFYTSMGHREDVWTNPIFHQIVVGGLRWACGNVEADITPNIQSVTPEAHTLKPKTA